MPVDVDLRKLRYFVAVAEELNFGRAAGRLHVAQPVLSRQIKALESELGVQLFRRDKRGTELTRAGEQLLADAGPLLAEAAALRRRVTRAARPRESFIVGFMPGLIVTPAVRAFGGRHPELAVEVLLTSYPTQTAFIRDGQVDVSYIRTPVQRRGLSLRLLLKEPRAVVLPRSHRLAGKESIRLADLAGERALQPAEVVPEWREISATRPAQLPAMDTVEAKLEHVAAGHGLVILPLSTALFYTRPDLTWAVVEDIAPSEVHLAWDSARRSPLLAEFAAIAVDSVPELTARQ
jgi:DNA-binding transcriptional LysR family regulator